MGTALPIVKDMNGDGRWFYSVGTGNVASGYTDPLGTSNYLNGFDGYQYPELTLTRNTHGRTFQLICSRSGTSSMSAP